MNTPMLAVNIFYPYTFATKKNDIYLLKRIKNRENKIINYIELFNKDFYDKYAVSQTKMTQYGYVALENTKDEILEATKEFLEINKGNFYNLNKDQKSFIKNIPQTSCFRYLDSRISCYFQKKYPELFWWKTIINYTKFRFSKILQKLSINGFFSYKENSFINE